jgi:hypothetical protein
VFFLSAMAMGHFEAFCSEQARDFNGFERFEGSVA